MADDAAPPAFPRRRDRTRTLLDVAVPTLAFAAVLRWLVAGAQTVGAGTLVPTPTTPTGPALLAAVLLATVLLATVLLTLAAAGSTRWSALAGREPDGRGAGAPTAGWRLWVPLGTVLAPAGLAIATHDTVLDLAAVVGLSLVAARLRLTGDPATERRLARELADLTHRFEHESMHDPLTGLANRSRFGAELATAWGDHRRIGRPLTLLALDLDGFKSVNDRFGHHVGDQLLTVAAERMRRCVGAGDTIARLGGDEFAIVLPGSDAERAETTADRILTAFADAVTIEGQVHDLACSVGVVQGSTRHEEACELVREADIALYAAKTTGKGHHRTYAPGLERETEVTVPDVETATAHAWASYLRDLRDQIRERKLDGRLPMQTRAPDGVHRTMQRVLAAIELLPDDRTRSTLVLPAQQELEEFVFHQTAVQHWADALADEGLLDVHRGEAADRFWDRLVARATPDAQPPMRSGVLVAADPSASSAVPG